MANAIYPKWKEAVVQAAANSALNGSGVTGVYVALIDKTVYTYSASHQYYSDLSGIINTPQELTGKSYTNGLLNTSNPTMTYTLVTGNQIGAIALYIQNAGANTTWRLYAYIDTGVTGLPVTPNGGSITITWNPSGIIQD